MKRIYISPEEYLIRLLRRKNDRFSSWPQNLYLSRWTKFYDIVRRNQLQLFCRRSFLSQASFLSDVPSWIQKQLIADELSITQTADLQKKEFCHIINSLNDAGVHFVVMKTFLHSSQVERIILLKASCDLDLLMPIADFRIASSVLIENNYLWYIDHVKRYTTKDCTSDYYTPQAEEIFRKGPYEIELHTRIVGNEPSLSHVMSETTNRNLTQILSGWTTPTAHRNRHIHIFSPTGLIMSLFIHLFYQHNYRGLRRYLEIAQIIESYENSIKWNTLHNTSQKFHLHSYFRWFLLLLDRLFPDVLPTSVKRRVYKYKLNFLEKLLFDRMLHQVFYPDDSPRSEKQKKLFWAIIDGRFPQQVLSFMYKRLSLPSR